MVSIIDPAASGVVPFEARPPFEPCGDATAPPPGAAAPYAVLRPTAATRAMVTPRPWDDVHATLGFPPDHRYVRRFWTAAIGPGAVAELIRLAVAAGRDRSLPTPVHLGLLLREGLVAVDGDSLLVRTSIPPLAKRHVSRLPPPLRREHAKVRIGV